MKELLEHFIREAIEWIFRRRSRTLWIMRFGVICFALAFGAGWILDVSLPIQDGQVEISLNSAGETPKVIVYLTTTIGVILIFGGLLWEICDYKVRQRRFERKKVVVIEARGLRDSVGSPLINALPATLKGQQEHVLVDLRQRVKDGGIVVPEAVLTDLNSLTADIRRRENGFDRRDLTLVYGGLTPVPFTFLTGVLIDDERKVLIFDWDRHGETWRGLGDEDDGKRFQVPNLTKG